MAGMDLPLRAIRDQIASALDLVVHISRLRDGSRRVTQISEIVGAEGDIVSMSDLFAFDYQRGHGRRRPPPGRAHARPGCARRSPSGCVTPASSSRPGCSASAAALARPGVRR